MCLHNASGLEASERAFPERVAQDERISGFMHNLPRQYIDRDWSKVTQTGTLDLSNINEVPITFPLDEFVSLVSLSRDLS